MTTRPEFDASADFVAALNFRFAGRAVAKGGNIDKAQVNERTLKLLYDQRRIDVAPEETEEQRAAAQGGEVPFTPTEEQEARIADLIASNGREHLDAMALAAGVQDPNKLANKGEVATAIVKAEAGAA